MAIEDITEKSDIDRALTASLTTDSFIALFQRALSTLDEGELAYILDVMADTSK